MADALMFTLFAFMFVGPLVLAIAGGVLLHLTRSWPLLRTTLLLLIPHLFFCGLFLASLSHVPGEGFSSFGYRLSVDEVYRFIFALSAGWFIVLVFLQMPALYFVQPPGVRSWVISTRASLAAAGLVFVLLAAAFWPVTDLSLARLPRTEEWLTLLPSDSMSLYFIRDGQVYKGNLTADRFLPLRHVTDPLDELMFFGTEPGRGEVWLVNRGARVELVEPTENSDRWIPSDAAHAAFFHGYGPAGDLHVPPTFALASPFFRWEAGRENVFPTGELIFELGNRIFFYSTKTQKLAFLSEGRSPLLIVKKAPPKN
ncbi:MAG TPA: hypothetical protein VFV50_06695 [Bdellovibrionales bacterium]|nr:hypothetical protein [Bdellovibrionales bacterium]